MCQPALVMLIVGCHIVCAGGFWIADLLNALRYRENLWYTLAMIKFPYGISDFHAISSEGYFYIDRSGCIPLLEEAGRQLLFLRPRRFGKSMLLSLLENYYDLARADEFAQLFGHLAIGKQPTPLHNRYFVMTWDFSVIVTSLSTEEMQQSVYDHINSQIDRFVARYQKFLTRPITIHPQNALSSFASLLAAVSQTPNKLYLLIDEYDNFANEVLMSSIATGRNRYEKMVMGEGFFKTIFKMIKSAARGQGLERVFITGVSPLVVSDMSSGYNVAENLYLLPEFADLCGFREAEVVDVLARVCQQCQFSPTQQAETLHLMRTFYDGYCFSPRRAERVYNPTLVIYFLKALQNDCLYPQEMLDGNLSMDRTRIGYIAQLGRADEIINAALNEATPLSTRTLAQRFGVDDLMSLGDKGKEFLASLLYYFGVLTLAGRNDLLEYVLHIPNLVVRQLYAERLQELLLPDVHDREVALERVRIFFRTGDLQPLVAFIETRLFAAYDNRDYIAANELTIKTAFLSLLFNDTLYFVDSETAIRRTYADLTLILRPDLRHRQDLRDFVLEFKYLKLGDVKIEVLKEGATTPTLQPLDGRTVRQLSLDELRSLPEVQAQLDQARSQLQSYRRDLAAAYQGRVRLQTYAIVALGFDRLVCEEVVAD